MMKNLLTCARRLLVPLLAIFALPPAGCNLSGPTSPLGATVGGAQDIGYARLLIDRGTVPDSSIIVAEGLYSEHDIATVPGVCNDKLCLSLGYGFATAVDDGKPALFVQLGMTSTITPDQFKRSKLQLALVIDRSGSMSGGSMDAVKTALLALVEKLTPDDEVALVSFNTGADLMLPMAPVGDGRKLRSAINLIAAGGGTDIESGLALGYQQAAHAPSKSTHLKRVMLFTDAMPNAGRTDKGSFKDLAERHAAEGIGLTAFGVGIDFGQELTYYITQLRGGNFFYLGNEERIRTVFDKEFEYLVTPIVYDLNITLPTPEGLRLRAVYGLPTWKPGARDAELHVPTVFLSSNRGAIVLRYEHEDGGEFTLGDGAVLARGVLDYVDPEAGGRHKEAEIRHTGGTPSAGGSYFSHDGARMAVALTNVYYGLRLGCGLYHSGRKAEAIAMVNSARAAAEADNLTLHDAGLDTEIKLLEKLATNMQ